MKKKGQWELIIGAPAEYAELPYATGFRAPDPVVFLRHGDRQYLIVSQLEEGRAGRVAERHDRESGRRTRVLTPARLKIKGQERRSPMAWALAALKQKKIHSVRVPRKFPLSAARRLEQAGIRIRIARDDLFPERAIKGSEEIRRIRESQQAAVLAMRGAVAMIAEADIDAQGALKIKGSALTCEKVRRAITQTLLKHDCVGIDTIVAGGIQSADPHEKGQGPLRAREPVVIDIFPQHMDHGYWGDLTRTVVKGRAPTMVKKMYHAVKAAQIAALNAVKAEVKCSTVHKKAARIFSQRGFETKNLNGRMVGFIHGTGHGVGLTIHERPAVASGEDRLKSGHIITIEPGLYYPDIGGVRIEDTIEVTRTGWRYLVPCEKRFEL